MTFQKKYNFIIAGSGCAGLSLAIALKNSKVKFDKILIVDKDTKNENDRTWCFWAKEQTAWYTQLATKKWNSFNFYSHHFSQEININPYNYYFLKGINFYNYAKIELNNDARFEFLTSEIKSITTQNNSALLVTNTQTFEADYIFNSAFRSQAIKPKDVNLVQHFLGWFIKTEDNFFENKLPTFMDFTVHQQNDCRFMYVIPTGNNSALVEYTGFSPKALIDKKEYEVEIQNYICNILKINSFTITEKEYGEIPMAESKFVNPFGKHVINIGTAGGQSKTSTGYTFNFIQKSTAQLINQLEKGQFPCITSKSKYGLYDKIFLSVLNGKKLHGDALFAMLFKKNNPNHLLAFLNNESTFLEELKIMNSVPKSIFVPAAIKKIFS